MSLLAGFIETIAFLLNLVIILYIWIIIARAVISWVTPYYYHPLVRWIYRLTEPVLRPIRSRLPVIYRGMDLSPLVVLLALFILRILLVSSLLRLARSLF